MNRGDKPGVAAPNNPLIFDMEEDRYDTNCKELEEGPHSRTRTIQREKLVTVWEW